MHPLHDYVAKQLAEKLKSKKLVVWYDGRREFVSFVGEVRGAAKTVSGTVPVTVGGIVTRLAEYDGSMFELRAVAEPYVSGDVPESMVIYLPGCERDLHGSVLMELEKAGESYEPQLKRLARNVLRQRYTDGVIDEMLASDKVTYEDLARASSETSSGEPPSILKSIFHDTSGNDGLLAAWLVSDLRDAVIQAKEASRELTKLVRSRLGLELPEDAGLAKLRSVTLRYVLAGEFRSDLSCAPPTSLDAIQAPKTKEDEAAVRELARRLRTSFSEVYPAMADRVEDELGLRNAKVQAECLGAIDTFRFEEGALLTHCGSLVAEKKFDDALRLVDQREHSFWLDRDVGRRAQWEACRRMAELGTVADSVKAAVAKAGGDVNAWVEAYTSKNGWYRIDQTHRRLEAWVTNLDDEPEERALGVVRRLYEDVCQSMADGFTKVLVKANWAVSMSTHQTRIYSEVVAEQPKPVAYFLVDAMRFEMGMEFSERLPKTAEVSVRHAIGALPSITPIGMAALQPGASASFSVVEQGGKLGARIEDTFLPDLAARKKFASAHVPKLVDLALDELLSLQPSRLARRIEGAQVVVVRSQEIDHAGEAGFTFQARQVMDNVIDNLARGIRKLAAAGVEHSVVSADHGHLFFASDRDESMRIVAPGGDEVDLHRRCWIGRGGTTPSGCTRVAASALGYDSDLDFVFPSGCGVFKAGGDLAFHHGGPSLQEMIVPVLTVRMKVRDSARTSDAPMTATGLPDAVTNRIFSVTLQLGGQNLSLFSSAAVVRPLLMSSGKQVGAVGMAIDAELDRATGCVRIQPGKPITVAFLLSDESAASLRVVVQDPATDAELYRSPTDIPVRLGV
jgi:PglZ domain